MAIHACLCAVVMAGMTSSLPYSNFTREPFTKADPDAVEFPIEEYRKAEQRQLQQSPHDHQASHFRLVTSGPGIELEQAVNNSSFQLQPISHDDNIATNSRDKKLHLRESSDSTCDPRQQLTDWPCYRNYRYGCMDNYCRRAWTPKASLAAYAPYGLYWYDYQEDGYFSCKKHEDCLKKWKSIEAKKPGYIPCTNKGYWSWYCHQGLHYGCGTRTCTSDCKCWHETGNMGWDYALLPHYKYTDIKCTKSNQHEKCNRYTAVFEHGDK